MQKPIVKFSVYIGLVMSMFFLSAMTGCKKNDSAQKDGDTAKEVVQQDAAHAVEAPAPAEAEPAAAPQPAAAPGCEKWGDIPMFKDGSEFIYKVHLENEACCDLEGDDWECDDMGACTRDVSFEIKCKAALKQAEKYFCVSEITCTTDAKYTSELDSFLPGSRWFIDSNGLYFENSIKELTKLAEPGKCKDSKYINCVPETLAYEFDGFQIGQPLIPFSTKKDIDVNECDDDDFCYSYSVSHKGDIWKSVESNDGGDSSSTTVVFDTKRGITRYVSEFSGGTERTMTAELK